MKSFDYNGKQVVFNEAVGIVAGTHKHAETTVSGSGGGGSTYNGQGHTDAVSITSTITVKQEFFLKTANGKQVPVQLSGMDIPIMDGQNVTMISVLDGKDKHWTHLVNHDTELYWPIGNARELVIAADLVRPPAFSFVIGLAIWIGSALIGIAVAGAGGLGFVAMVGFWVFEWMRLRKAARLLGEHINHLGQEALKARPLVAMA